MLWLVMQECDSRYPQVATRLHSDGRQLLECVESALEVLLLLPHILSQWVQVPIYIVNTSAQKEGHRNYFEAKVYTIQIHGAFGILTVPARGTS